MNVMENEETPLRYKVMACTGAAIGYLALALGATGALLWSIDAKRNRKELDREYQTLPAETRIYDSNKDEVFDSRELGNLIRDYELKKK